AQGQQADRRADLYSLGLVAYQMLSGRLPFQADTPQAVLFQHIHVPPHPLQDAAPDVPPPLRPLLEPMMAPRPATRHPRAEDMRADLERFRTGQHDAITADPEQTTELPLPRTAFASRVRRRVVMAGMLGLILLGGALLAGTALLVIGSLTSEKEAAPLLP